MKESEAQAAICDYLAARRVFFVRLNNIPASYIDAQGNRQFRSMGKYARPGLADILAIKRGRPIFLEVKAEKGKPSAEQFEFCNDVLAAGADYHVVRSIDDVIALGL